MVAATTFTKVFFARPDRVPAIRAWTAQRLRGSSRAADVVQAVSELATNVIFHTTSVQVSVSLCVTPDQIRLRVTNSGQPIADNTERLSDLGLPRDELDGLDDLDGLMDGLDIGGRGLGIIHALADASGVQNGTPAGHVVWAHYSHRMAQPAAAAAAPARVTSAVAAHAQPVPAT